jgi:hypothetical protein
VTVERGPNERREPIFLKERTEREGKHEGGGGAGGPNKNTHPRRG